MMHEARHDGWNSGDSYDVYMGRWSRKIAVAFLDWLAPASDLDWLDVGSGTGALSKEILDHCAPQSVLGIEPSEEFAGTARANIVDVRATFEIGDAMALPVAGDSRDAVVSGLALNFVPDPVRALSEMRRVARRTGVVAFYVWDYPSGGVHFISAFWQAAAALDSSAAELTEARRFSSCTPEGLLGYAAACGMTGGECVALETLTVFADFDDYWRPFTLGAGPAPGYCATLTPEQRERLRERLRVELPTRRDGSIVLPARAWAVRGR